MLKTPNLPLASLISRLRAAGFAMDPSREMQLRRALHERGDEYIGRLEELKYLFAPYVATNAAEQRRFYALWDDYVADLVKRTKAVDEESAPVKEESAPRWQKVFLGLAITFIVFTLGMIGYFAWQKVQEGFFDHSGRDFVYLRYIVR